MVGNCLQTINKSYWVKGVVKMCQCTGVSINTLREKSDRVG